MPFSRDRERECLEREINGESYQTMLRGLQTKEPLFKRFEFWGCVVKFMQDDSSPEASKDNVIRCILRAHQEDRDPRWRTILLVILWPILEAVYFKKRKWDHDLDDLWQNLVWMFLNVISRLKLENRSHNLARKIINDTAHRLHDEYKRLWKRSELEDPTDREKLEEVAAGVEGMEFKAFEIREEQKAEIKKLRSYREAGVITEADFMLLVATRVYGQRLIDYARKAGVPYEYARRRRLQVEDKIRRKENKSPLRNS